VHTARHGIARVDCARVLVVAAAIVGCVGTFSRDGVAFVNRTIDGVVTETGRDTLANALLSRARSGTTTGGQRIQYHGKAPATSSVACLVGTQRVAIFGSTAGSFLVTQCLLLPDMLFLYIDSMKHRRRKCLINVAHLHFGDRFEHATSALLTSAITGLPLSTGNGRRVAYL
jgi:hypothetical protein